MNILHLDTRPDWRGGQQQILLTIRGLRARGHAVELAALRDSPLCDRAGREGFTVHPIPRTFLRANLAREIRRWLGEELFEIVHAHDPHALTAAWLAGAHRRAALVAARRVAYPLSRSAVGLARYRAAHSIIAVSRYVAESVVAAGIAASRVAVVYDGVEIPERTTPEMSARSRARWKIGEDEPLLGCVGYLLPEKGQEILIRALPLIRQRSPRAKLFLAGDGPCRPALEKLARDSGISHAVIFAGFLDDVAEAYRAFYLFLFPSLDEPLGSSLLSAMSYELPAVAVASGGVPEIISNGRDGILVSAAARPEDFAAAAISLLENRAEAARLGMAARATISARFTADRLVEETLSEYRNALAHANRA
ncbi:MAG: glycosyltransferase family 4 protein [Candidatus Acidiferrales bacterium]